MRAINIFFNLFDITIIELIKDKIINGEKLLLVI